MENKARFIVIAVRDFPDLTEWRGSYFVQAADTMGEAILIAQYETGQRGGKYGCIIYDTTIPERDQCHTVPRSDWSLYTQMPCPSLT